MKQFKDEMKIYLVLIAVSLISISNHLSAESVYTKEPSWIGDAIKKFGEQTELSKKVENRVMFDEDIGWSLSRANTDKIISNLSAAGFNVYIPCIWHGSGTYFFSDIAYLNRQLKERKLRGDDPLTYLIQKAHEKHIEVHPWVTVVLRDDSLYTNYYDEFTPAQAFDVHNEKFIEFITSMMRDVIDRYDLDGINLDYIRSMGYCTSEKCSVDYQKKTSRDLAVDLLLEKVPKSRIKSIEDWNAESINKIVKNISDYRKKVKPKVIVSVDSVPEARHLRMQGQDSLMWLNKGWIDTIFYMAYETEIDVARIESIKKMVSKPDAIIPLFAIYDFETLEKKSGDLLNRTIAAERLIWPNSGVAFYHYKQMSYDQVQKLGSGVFSLVACPNWRHCELLQ